MQEMTLCDIRGLYIQANDLVKVFCGMRLAYAGPAFLIPEEYEVDYVAALRPELETRRKGWQTAGLWAPLNPETVETVRLKDAEQRLYWRITLRERK